MKRPLLLIAVIVSTFLSKGCGENANNPPPAGRVFLDDKKAVGSGLEWSRDITSKKGGEITFRVASQGPFVVNILTDQAYKSIMRNDRKSFKKEGVLLTFKSKETTYEGRVTLPPGTSWIMIKNEATESATIHLQCSARD